MSGGQWKGTCLWRKEQDPRRGTPLVVRWLRCYPPNSGGEARVQSLLRGLDPTCLH